MKAKPQRLEAIAVLVGVFVLGGAAGAALMRTHMLSDMRAAFDFPPIKVRARFRLEAMRRNLDLTPEQDAKIQQILRESEDERESAVAECRPEMQAIRQRTKQRIDEVLTAEQRAQHEELLERFRRRRGKHKHGRPHADRHPTAAPCAEPAESATTK